MDCKSKGQIAIVGSGLIGKSWAMLFVGAGYRVNLYDVVKKQVSEALVDIAQRLLGLEKSGMLRGEQSAEQQSKLVTGSDDLEECLRDVIYVQECVPESLEMKTAIFKDLDRLADVKTILASSSSAIPSSKFTESLAHRERCIIAHPVNPPYYMPLVELVPSPWTSPDVVERTRSLMTDLGQSPVTLKKEVRGFIQPRIQYAMIMECLKLVEDDVLDIDDVDKLIKDGLGMVFAFLGPFEMNHINNEGGIRSFFALEGEEVNVVASSLGSPVSMNSTTDLIKKISDRLTDVVPVERLVERRKWRDDRLAALARLRKTLEHS